MYDYALVVRLSYPVDCARAGPEANGDGASGSGPQRELNEPKSKRHVRPSSWSLSGMRDERPVTSEHRSRGIRDQCWPLAFSISARSFSWEGKKPGERKEQLVLAHIGWPAVALAVVYLIGRAIKKPDEWWRLMGTIVVLVAVILGAMIVCVQVLGMQLPGFNVPALSRTSAPAAIVSPQSSAPVTASPVVTASPSRSGAYPGGMGEELDPCSEADELLIPALLAHYGFDPEAPAARLRAGRSPGGQARAGSRWDVQSLRSAAAAVASERPPTSRLKKVSRTDRAGIQAGAVDGLADPQGRRDRSRTPAVRADLAAVPGRLGQDDPCGGLLPRRHRPAAAPVRAVRHPARHPAACIWPGSPLIRRGRG